MAYNYFQILIRLPDNLCRPCGYIGMAGSVKTVSSHLVILIIVIRKTIKISLLRHCLVERRIKNSRHRGIGHQFLARADSYQVRRIVERRQIVAFLNRLNHLVRNQGGGSKVLSAVNQPVSYRAYLVKALYHAVFLVRKRAKHQPDCLCVVFHGRYGFLLHAAGRCIGHLASFYSDSLAEPLCNHSFRFGIDELKFQ